MEQTNITDQKIPWVLVSSFKDTTNMHDLEKITPLIGKLIDDWHADGKIMWSGAFSDNKTSMAVFEGTAQEAKMFYEKYGKICSGILDYHMLQWDAMPLLSILSR